jgi:hypothetical protein
MSTTDQLASLLLGMRAATHMMDIIIDLCRSLASGIADAQLPAINGSGHDRCKGSSQIPVPEYWATLNAAWHHVS